MDGRRTGKLLAALALVGATLPGQVKADTVNSEWSSTTRALGMGNVGIATADDPSSAAFYNPAGLARIKKPVAEVFNPQLDLGGGLFSVAKSPADYVRSLNFSSSKPSLHASPNTPVSGGFSFFPNFATQNFELGILVANKGAGYYSARTNAYYYHSERLVVPTIGLSAAGLGGRLRLGVAARAVQISETNIVDLAGSGSTATALSNARDGVGFALDAGMLYSMAMAGLPTWGFVARNIGSTNLPGAPFLAFGQSESSRHERIPMTYDGGISIAPKIAQKDQITLALDYRDILNETRANYARHVNVGLEVSMLRTVYFRGGYSQGTWTAGLGLNAKAGAVDFSTYGEELDPTAYHGMLDRRYSLRLTRRF